MGMYNYTIRLYKYAKPTARESRICAQLFFRTKNSPFPITLYYSNIQEKQRKPMAKKTSPLATIGQWGCFLFLYKGNTIILTGRDTAKRKPDADLFTHRDDDTAVVGLGLQGIYPTLAFDNHVGTADAHLLQSSGYSFGTSL